MKGIIDLILKIGLERQDGEGGWGEAPEGGGTHTHTHTHTHT